MAPEVVEERQRGLTSLRQINRKTGEVVGIAFDERRRAPMVVSFW